MLMIDALGIVAVLCPHASTLENVEALLSHPHWRFISQVQDFLRLRNFRIKVLELSHLVPMRRKRCFICHFREQTDFPIGGLRTYRIDDHVWQLHGALEEPLSHEQARQLSDWNLLPAKLKAVTPKSADKVLKARLSLTTPLPVLVSAYYRQVNLPSKHLETAGAYTWLVQFGKGPVRYLHPLEAARLFGFPPSFGFPWDLSDAMEGIGNAVAPAQIVNLMLPLLRQLDVPVRFQVLKTDEAIALMLLGWPGNKHLALRGESSLLRPAVPSFPVTEWQVPKVVHLPGKASLCYLPRDNVDEHLLQQALGMGGRLKILSRDDTSEVLLVSLSPVEVQVSDFVFKFPRYLTWSEVQPLIGFHETHYSRKILHPDAPLATPKQCCFEHDDFPLSSEIVLLADAHRFVLPWTQDCDIRTYLRRALPFRLEHLLESVWSLRLNAFVGSTDPLPPGTYQVTFLPTKLRVEPIGLIDCYPLDTVQTIEKLLSLRLYAGKASIILTGNGASLQPTDYPLFLVSSQVLRVRCFPLKGGGFSIAAVEENLRSLLVEKGVPSGTVKDRVREVTDKISYEVLRKCLESRAPWTALKQEATKHHIRLLTVTEREAKSSADPLQENDPWFGAKFPKPTQPKRSPKKNPGPTQIDDTFFHCGGAALPVISVDSLFRGQSGLAISEKEEVFDRLPALMQRSRSTGGAALVVLGCSTAELEGEVSHRCSNILVPAWIGPHSSAVRALLIQTGDLDVSLKSTANRILLSEHSESKVLMLHIYKEEAQQMWPHLSHGAPFFLRQIGYEQARSIFQTWSLGYFKNSKKVPPTEAVYAHCFVRVSESVVDKLLSLSGRYGMYATPRSNDRGTDPAYKVIRLPGLTRDEAQLQADAVDTALGLVRSGRGYGVRVRQGSYASAKKTLFPDLDTSDESDSGGSKRFRLLNVPQTFDRATVKVLLQKLRWRAKVLRSEGVGTWLVSTAIAPEARSVDVNDHEVLLLEDRLDPPRNVVASTSRMVFSKPPEKLAPKVESATVKTAPVLPEFKSKFDQLEQKALERVETLETQVASLTQQFQEHAASTNGALEKVGQEVAHLGRMEGRLESFLKEYAATTDTRLKQVEERHEAALEEIKAALKDSSPKFRKDYAILSGGNVLGLKEDAVPELRRVFAWAQRLKGTGDYRTGDSLQYAFIIYENPRDCEQASSCQSLWLKALMCGRVAVPRWQRRITGGVACCADAKREVSLQSLQALEAEAFVAGHGCVTSGLIFEAHALEETVMELTTEPDEPVLTDELLLSEEAVQRRLQYKAQVASAVRSAARRLRCEQQRAMSELGK
eukprot:Skav234498  [mRNA]  locus=scaffold2015:27635:55825:- [translate_table: standard]